MLANHSFSLYLWREKTCSAVSALPTGAVNQARCVLSACRWVMGCGLLLQCACHHTRFAQFPGWSFQAKTSEVEKALFNDFTSLHLVACLLKTLVVKGNGNAHQWCPWPFPMGCFTHWPIRVTHFVRAELYAARKMWMFGRLGQRKTVLECNWKHRGVVCTRGFMWLSQSIQKAITVLGWRGRRLVRKTFGSPPLHAVQ